MDSSSGDNTVTSEAPQIEFDLFKAFTDPPVWMTKEYFEQVLRDSEKDPSLKLLDYRIKSATKPGDNFASIALRLWASYNTKGNDIAKNFILKIEHFEDGFKKVIMSEAQLFETEISMYTKTIPEMQRLIKEVDPTETIAPPLVYCSMKPHKMIVLEDISPEFVMHQRSLNFEESKLVFEKMATFHALSFSMGESHEPMKSYTHGFISNHLDGKSDFLVQNVMILAATLAEWGPEMEVPSKKLMALGPTIFEKLKTIYTRNRTTGYNVLNHGDFHVKNILFRNEEESAVAGENSRLIDFQMCIWATPAIDLMYGLYALVGHEAREHRDELIRHYHEHFCAVLGRLGYLNAPPTLLDLQVELLRNGLIEVFLVAFLLPLLSVPPTQSVEDVGVMTAEKMVEMRRAVLEEPSLKKAIMKLMPVFLQKGLLDL